MTKLYNDNEIKWYIDGQFIDDHETVLSGCEYSPAEQWFLDQITDLEEVRSNKYPESIFYKKNGEVLFEYNQKTNYFWVHYSKIWLFFESNYGLNYQEIRDLIRGVVEEHLNLGGVTPGKSVPLQIVWWRNI